jgi:hypothetical protein
MALVELGRYGFPEGEIIAGRLRAAGIDAVTFDSAVHQALGGFLMVPVRVMVDETDLAAARAILASPPDQDLPDY